MFRYFPTKEDLVTTDDLDPVHIIGAIDLVAELSAKRLGRDPNDPAVRNASGA